MGRGRHPTARKLVAVVLLGGLLAGSLPGPPASPQSPRNVMRAETVLTSVNTDAPLCQRVRLEGESEPGYGLQYSVRDRRGGEHAYQGELRLTLAAGPMFENDSGTHATSACDKAGHPQPLTGASLTSTSPSADSGVVCRYAQGTYRRVGADITIDLSGICSIKQGGVVYEANTVETRQGKVLERRPTSQFSFEIRWEEDNKFHFTTTCISPSCDAPGPPGVATSAGTSSGDPGLGGLGGLGDFGGLSGGGPAGVGAGRRGGVFSTPFAVDQTGTPVDPGAIQGELFSLGGLGEAGDVGTSEFALPPPSAIQPTGGDDGDLWIPLLVFLVFLTVGAGTLVAYSKVTQRPLLGWLPAWVPRLQWRSLRRSLARRSWWRALPWASTRGRRRRRALPRAGRPSGWPRGRPATLRRSR